MPRDKPNSADMEATRETRVAARRMQNQERYQAFLRLARRTALDIGEDDPDLKRLVEEGRDRLEDLIRKAGGWIAGRRRPQNQGGEPCAVYLDECGSHSLKAKEDFDAFVLAAVIVRRADYDDLDTRWRAWKDAKLGSADKIIHEPNLRRLNGPFNFSGDKLKGMNAAESLRSFIAKLDFSVVTCVMHRPEYSALAGDDALDESLPLHPYLMTLNFLAERVVMALENHYDGARAKVVAESRGPLEDALLQYEFARLHLDGTSYVSGAWFRQALAPGIEFRDKKENISGLQLADLAARPCGEKVLDPSSTPDRWPEFRDKLCQGIETAHSIIGLKITPWDDKYDGIWKS